MRKELTVYISTNEDGEEVRISRVNDGTDQFMLLTAGVNRLVLNIEELLEAVGAIGHYSTLFDQEHKMRELRKNSSPAAQIPARVSIEGEKELIVDAQIRSGPTASELALEKQMSSLGSLLFTEKGE